VGPRRPATWPRNVNPGRRRSPRSNAALGPGTGLRGLAGLTHLRDETPTRSRDPACGWRTTWSIDHRGPSTGRGATYPDLSWGKFLAAACSTRRSGSACGIAVGETTSPRAVQLGLSSPGSGEQPAVGRGASTRSAQIKRPGPTEARPPRVWGICLAPPHLWVMGESITEGDHLPGRTQEALPTTTSGTSTGPTDRGEDGLDFGPGERQLPPGRWRTRPTGRCRSPGWTGSVTRGQASPQNGHGHRRLAAKAGFTGRSWRRADAYVPVLHRPDPLTTQYPQRGGNPTMGRN